MGREAAGCRPIALIATEHSWCTGAGSPWGRAQGWAPALGVAGGQLTRASPEHSFTHCDGKAVSQQVEGGPKVRAGLFQKGEPQAAPHLVGAGSKSWPRFCPAQGPGHWSIWADRGCPRGGLSSGGSGPAPASELPPGGGTFQSFPAHPAGARPEPGRSRAGAGAARCGHSGAGPGGRARQGGPAWAPGRGAGTPPSRWRRRVDFGPRPAREAGPRGQGRGGAAAVPSLAFPGGRGRSSCAWSCTSSSVWRSLQLPRPLP